jgi:hypothetical protein
VKDPGSITLCVPGPGYRPGPGRPIIQLPEPLDRRDFEAFMKELKRVSFDNDKILFLTASAGYNSFYTEQVKEIMRTFSFDENKLACVQMLVPCIVDPQNIYSLSSEFSFKSTSDKFFQFLSNNKP